MLSQRYPHVIMNKEVDCRPTLLREEIKSNGLEEQYQEYDHENYAEEKFVAKTSVYSEYQPKVNT